ncbi:MAG: hypothetical protein ACKO96_46060, partial [Flammeovirgaceae bacterium]
QLWQTTLELAILKIMVMVLNKMLMMICILMIVKAPKIIQVKNNSKRMVLNKLHNNKEMINKWKKKVRIHKIIMIYYLIKRSLLNQIKKE